MYYWPENLNWISDLSPQCNRNTSNGEFSSVRRYFQANCFAEVLQGTARATYLLGWKDRVSHWKFRELAENSLTLKSRRNAESYCKLNNTTVSIPRDRSSASFDDWDTFRLRYIFCVWPVSQNYQELTRIELKFSAWEFFFSIIRVEISFPL